MGTILVVNNISCARQLTPVFSNLSFCLSAGHALLIEGVNGAGKSSLLRLLAGLATPTSGDILWKNTARLESLHYIGHQNGLKLDLTVSENFRLKGALAGDIAYDVIPAQAGIHPKYTASVNLRMGSRLRRNDTKDNPLAIENNNSILQALQLHSLLNKPVRSLSAGQKRRVALAMLWLNPKKIWLLDEPLTALDTTTQHLFLNYLDEHLTNNGVAIISSHHPIVLPTNIYQVIRLPAC